QNFKTNLRPKAFRLKSVAVNDADIFNGPSKFCCINVERDRPVFVAEEGDDDADDNGDELLFNGCDVRDEFEIIRSSGVELLLFAACLIICNFANGTIIASTVFGL
ncbi:hypothetical protein DERP_003701, partial [Dermatophagoides pteronyssinus]